MIAVKGRLVDPADHSFAGHQVAFSYNEKVKVDGADHAEAVFKPTEQRAAAAADGRFALSLPDKNQLKEPVVVTVIAPDGEQLLLREIPIEALEQEIRIEVAAKTFFDITPSDDPFLGQRPKLTGRVIDLAGKCIAADKQVTLWARPPEAEDDAFAVVLVACTDANGYFSGDYPRGRFAEAYGIVAGAEQEKIPIPLEDGVFPRHVILVADIPEADAEEESCACRAQVPRAPDQDDLCASSSAYSTDKGGRCVDLTVPNRTLEEFSYYSLVRTTEPEIKGLTLTEPKKVPINVIRDFANSLFSANATMTKIITDTSPSAAAMMRLPSAGAAAPAAAEAALPKLVKNVSPSVLKAFAADPDNFTPATLLTAEKMTLFKDFSRLVDIFKKAVPGRANLSSDNPVDWDDEPTFYQATTIAHGHILHFKQIWKADGYSLGDLLYSLPLAPCQKKQIAVIDWDRRESAARTERLEAEDRLDAMISRDRDISEIVNASLRESLRGGSEASTWAAGGGIGFALGPVVIGAGGGGGGASSSAWQNSARDTSANLLQQLRDRTLQSASSLRSQRSTVVQLVNQGETMRVQTEVVANHNHCHAITMEYFEVLRHFCVEQRLVDVQECLFVPLLMSKFDRPKALRWREALSRFLRNPALRGGFDALERIQNNYEGSDLPPGRYSQETLEYLDGELRISFQLSRPRDKDDETFEEANWLLFAPFLWTSPLAIFNQYFTGRIQAERDRIFQSEIAPRIAEAFVQKLRFYLIGSSGEVEVKLDPTLVSSYTPNVPLYVSLRPAGAVPAVAREWVTRFEIRANHPLPPYSKAMVHTGSVRYRTKYMSHFLFRDWRIDNDLVPGDPTQVPTYPDRQELRNPREEDKELAKKLLAHLNEHIEHYHRAIWWSMDPQRRYMLLDGFVAPNAKGKSVASVVENRLIGIVGNCMVLPVARGFKLDPTYNQDAENPIDLLHLYAPNTPIPPMRVSVPTRGVFAEAVMGACNSCEEKDDTRFWRFEESPCGDEPTPIQPLSTESRRADPGDLRAKDFASPIIAMQNAPAAPDPTGLSQALQLLGTPNLFRDVTGLTENQRNALAAFQAAMETSRFFGGQAANLALQRNMSRDIDKTMKTIQGAKQSGLLTEQQAQSLTESAIRGMVGGGAGPQPTPLTQAPEVKSAIQAGSARGDAVRVQRGDESVEVTPPSGQGAGGGAAEFRNALGLPGENTLILAGIGATAAGLRVRKSHRSLTPEEQTAFKAAITRMHNEDKPGTGKRFWQFYVDIHADAAKMENENWGAHRPMTFGAVNNFLAWHREYLSKFEADLGVPLPYWDWLNSASLPAVVSDPADLAAWGVTRHGVDDPFPGVRMPTAVEVQTALNNADFRSFQSLIEDLHGAVHVFVGGRNGDMSEIATAARDPIFWMHHAMVDMLWAQWQARHGGNPPNADDVLQPAPPFTHRVREVLNIRDLGYTYEGLRTAAILTSPAPATVLV